MARHEPRNYKAEYRRRKELAAERGLSTAQARGHARTGKSEQGVAALKRAGTVESAKVSTLDKFYRVVDKMRQGVPLSKAARQEGISTDTVNRLNKDRRLYGKTYRDAKTPGKRAVFNGYEVGAHARMHIFTRAGEYLPHVPLDARNSSIMGRYWNAVDKALAGDDGDLRRFARVTVYDVNGNTYQLLTDANAVRRMFDGMTSTDARDFDRVFYSGREVLHYAA